VAESSRDRLRSLYASVLVIAERLDGLDPVKTNGDGDGGTVRYTSPRGSEALLDVRPERVSVTTRSADLHPDAGNSTIVDDLGVDLSAGYLWDDVSCDSADELADLLVKHMRRRTKDVDPEPLGGEAR
jgi:hypothetical protein